MKHKIQNLHEDVRVYRASAKKIKCKSEMAEQINFYQWFITWHRDLKQSMFHVPNETQGQKNKDGKLTGPAYRKQQRLNEAGRSAGVSDLILLHQTKNYPYAVIEMKSKDGQSMPSPEEKLFLNHHAEKGAFACICWGAEEAKKAINDYLHS